jgi:hypothetical protein
MTAERARAAFRRVGRRPGANRLPGLGESGRRALFMAI